VSLLLRETHYLDWDAPGRVKVRALCGVYIRRREHAEAPTCPVCRQALEARTARDTAAGRWWDDYETKGDR
jgi:hypothetical protein